LEAKTLALPNTKAHFGRSGKLDFLIGRKTHQPSHSSSTICKAKEANLWNPLNWIRSESSVTQNVTFRWRRQRLITVSHPRDGNKHEQILSWPNEIYIFWNKCYFISLVSFRFLFSLSNKTFIKFAFLVASFFLGWIVGRQICESFSGQVAFFLSPITDLSIKKCYQCRVYYYLNGGAWA
jgi:hypothetical protein